MHQTLIGAGGWAYFNLPSPSPLRAYSEAFNYVEVNSTFYEIPPLKEVEVWRRSVPEDFHFTVRAHRSITHGQPFVDSDAAHGSYQKMQEICRVLRADILHLQLPPSAVPDSWLARAIADFLNSHESDPVRLALECRGSPSLKDCPDMLRTMQDRGIIHCVDPLKGQKPAVGGDTLYARLFGMGRHNLYQPSDDELRSLDEMASGYSRAFLTFHGARMYSDAARLKTYKAKGRFPQLTKTTGLDSLGIVLAEDARFPTTKAELSHDQGWKLFDASGDRRMRVGEVLDLLPEGTYPSLDLVLREIRDRGLFT